MAAAVILTLASLGTWSIVTTALTYTRASNLDVLSGAYRLIPVLGIPLLVTAGAIGLAVAQAMSAFAGAGLPWPGWRQHLRPPLDRVVAHRVVRSDFPAYGEHADDHQVRFCACMVVRRSIRGVVDVGEPGSIVVLDATQVDLPPDLGPSSEVIELLPAIIRPLNAS